MVGSSLVAAQLAACQEGLGSAPQVIVFSCSSNTQISTDSSVTNNLNRKKRNVPLRVL
jgi:hypothetical protein